VSESGEETVAEVVAEGRKPRSAVLAIVLALISAAVTITVALLKPQTPHLPPAPPDDVSPPIVTARQRAETAFGQFERAVSRYVGAADDFGDIYFRRGSLAFTSEVAQQEIDSRGVQLSAAFHELNDGGPRYLRDLQAALPGRVALVQDATDLLNHVLRELHENGVRRLNRVSDVINDHNGKPTQKKIIKDNLASVDVAVQVIRRECLRATEQLNTLRRSFGTVIAELGGSRK
jgi:hypothetical protein